MSDEQGTIPEGMKAWAGGDSAPADWDGGKVLCDDGAMYGSPIEWSRPSGGPDVIAYTPHSKIPVGMVQWTGGKGAPVDWDGGKVFYRDGGTGLYPHDRAECWSHKNPSPDDIIAYTPAAGRLTDTGEGLPTDRYGETALDRIRDYAVNGTMPPHFRKDLFSVLDLATPKPPVDAGAMRERCAQACEDQAASFLSPQYATGQPLSSFQERFACQQCADAIRNLPIPGDSL